MSNKGKLSLKKTATPPTNGNFKFQSNYLAAHGPAPGAHIKLQLGMLHTAVYGGPYSARPKNKVGVKLAAELGLPCNVNVPIEDFSTPDPAVMLRGMMATMMLLATGSLVYVGCAGGIGRTGLFMASLVKAMGEINGEDIDPVAYVRSHYYSGAVETEGQKEFIRSLDVTPLVEWWKQTEGLLYGDTFNVPHIYGVTVGLPKQRSFADQSWVKKVLTKLS